MFSNLLPIGGQVGPLPATALPALNVRVTNSVKWSTEAKKRPLPVVELSVCLNPSARLLGIDPKYLHRLVRNLNLRSELH